MRRTKSVPDVPAGTEVRSSATWYRTSCPMVVVFKLVVVPNEGDCPSVTFKKLSRLAAKVGTSGFPRVSTNPTSSASLICDESRSNLIRTSKSKALAVAGTVHDVLRLESSESPSIICWFVKVPAFPCVPPVS